MSVGLLPRKALFLWRLRCLITCIPFSVVGGFLYFTTINVFTIYTFCWMSLFILVCLVYLPMRYSQFTFAVTNSMVKVNQGVFYFSMNAIYLSNIQYTSLSQTPLQKLLDLATLHIFAAGGAVHIPCLPYADARILRVQLLTKMESCLHDQNKNQSKPN